MRRLDRAFDQLASRGRRSDPEIVIERLERRLAGQPIPVVVPGRFDMDKSGSSVSGRKGVLIAAAAMVVVLAVAIPLWLVLGGDEPSVLSDETGITYALAPEGKTPQATLQDLVERQYAALTDQDGEAARAVNLEDAQGLIYIVQENQVSRLVRLGPTYDPGEDIDQVWQVLGEFATSGEVVAIPMRVEYPSEGEAVTGFDLWLVKRYQDGLLCAGGVTFMAFEPFVALDPAEVEDILAAQSSAWRAGDVATALGGYVSDASYLNGFTIVGAARLSEFFTGIRFDYLGEPAISGPFVAVPTRVTNVESGASTDGVSVYWIRDGEIAFHAFSPGT